MTDFVGSAPDWRAQLRKNAARTRWVIFIFLLLYISVGLLIDLFIHGSGYVDAITGQVYYVGGPMPPTLWQTFVALLTFHIIPWATFVMLGVAVISLFITYSMYDRIMLLGTQYVEVTMDTKEPALQPLYHVVEEMKVAAGMRYMPKIFLINADYMNAFASGFSEKSAMIAITKGLFEKLNRAELQAVMAHELSHIRHGDIKLTLTASVLSNLMLMAIDILFYNVLFSRNRKGNANALIAVIAIVRFVLPLVTVLLMLYLSRTREYMADAGCVELQRDNEPLANALLKIEGDHQQHADQYASLYQQTPHESVRRESYIYDPSLAGLKATGSPNAWFSTHPSVKQRLKALGIERN